MLAGQFGVSIAAVHTVFSSLSSCAVVQANDMGFSLLFGLALLGFGGFTAMLAAAEGKQGMPVHRILVLSP